MSTQDKFYTFYLESTPNPASMKFVANHLLIENGATAGYNTAKEAEKAPLIKKLFEFPFVKQLFVSQNYITITKTDAVSWDDVMLELRLFITDYLNKGGLIITELPSKEVAADSSFKETQTVFTEHAAPSNDVENKIVEILEQYIRPAVEQDGGLIVFKSFKEGVVTVQMKGACSGCPSSTMTLKAGIEALLKRLLPEDVKEVISEAA
ncbi:MAG: thioredoxin [Bacteroidetes bacterium]|jgi:Fe-S cluster biogenesis protein NfuA|nr:thioredoxin [Bacteroidota bacterium]